MANDTPEQPKAQDPVSSVLGFLRSAVSTVDNAAGRVAETGARADEVARGTVAQSANTATSAVTGEAPASATPQTYSPVDLLKGIFTAGKRAAAAVTAPQASSPAALQPAADAPAAVAQASPATNDDGSSVAQPGAPITAQDIGNGAKKLWGSVTGLLGSKPETASAPAGSEQVDMSRLNYATGVINAQNQGLLSAATPNDPTCKAAQAGLEKASAAFSDGHSIVIPPSAVGAKATLHQHMQTLATVPQNAAPLNAFSAKTVEVVTGCTIVNKKTGAKIKPYTMGQ